MFAELFLESHNYFEVDKYDNNQPIASRTCETEGFFYK